MSASRTTVRVGEVYRLNGTDHRFRVTRVYRKEGVAECVRLDTGGMYRYPVTQFVEEGAVYVPPVAKGTIRGRLSWDREAGR
jgi:hypothetical protein